MPRSFKYDSGDGVVDEFLNVPDDVSDEDYIAKMQLNSAEEKEITLFNKIDDTADSKEVFQEAYEFTRRHEGGFSNEKYDSPTQFGIAKRYWPEEHEKVRQMVISGDAVGAEAYTRNFYKKNFWDAVGADKLQRKDAVLMFDTAVLFSPEKAKTFYQESGGNLDIFLDLRQSYHEQKVKKEPVKLKFLEGWTNRVKDLREVVKPAMKPVRRPGTPNS